MKWESDVDEENETLSGLLLFLSCMTRPLRRALVADNVTF